MSSETTNLMLSRPRHTVVTETVEHPLVAASPFPHSMESLSRPDSQRWTVAGEAYDLLSGRPSYAVSTGTLENAGIIALAFPDTLQHDSGPFTRVGHPGNPVGPISPVLWNLYTDFGSVRVEMDTFACCHCFRAPTSVTAARLRVTDMARRT